MKFMSMLVATVLLSTYAQADVGMGQLMSCKSAKGTVEIHRTAAPNIFQATYTQKGKSGVKAVDFICDAKKARRDANVVSLYGCTENRNGEGRFLINVESGGVVGITQAYVTQEQMFPLPAAAVDTLICQ